jgi:DnaJ-class molecular chaperone
MLSDPKKREMYDQFGHAGVDPNSGFGQGGNPFSGFDFGDGSFHFSTGGSGPQDIDAEELFEAIFGGGRRRPRGPRQGADLQMRVHVSFMEAVFGASKDLHLRYQVRDSKSGQTKIKERDVVVEVPPGIDNGMNLRLSGQGAEGDPGAPKGNLLVQVVVEPDEYFVRDGFDVHTEVPISLTQAVLGGTVDVRTLSGEVEMKIPKGCQVDTKLMLRGKGIQRLDSKSFGNQIAHLKIEIPKTITPRQEELLREFDKETESCGGGISGKLAGAVENAFSSIFGGTKKEKKSKKKVEKVPNDEDELDKKQAVS